MDTDDRRDAAIEGGGRVGSLWLRRALPVVLLLTFVVAACAAGANPAVDSPAPDGDTAGFLLGFWHGLIIPVTFVISLFSDNVSVYEIHNNGNWYDFGYVLAIMLFVGGSAKSRR